MRLELLSASLGVFISSDKPETKKKKIQQVKFRTQREEKKVERKSAQEKDREQMVTLQLSCPQTAQSRTQRKGMRSEKLPSTKQS